MVQLCVDPDVIPQIFEKPSFLFAASSGEIHHQNCLRTELT